MTPAYAKRRMAATALECLASVVPRHPKMRDRSGGFISLSDVILTTPGFISLSDVILTTPGFISFSDVILTTPRLRKSAPGAFIGVRKNPCPLTNSR